MVLLDLARFRIHVSDHVGVHAAVPNRTVRRGPRVVGPGSLGRKSPFLEGNRHTSRNNDGRFWTFSDEILEEVIGHDRDLIRCHLCSRCDHALERESPLLTVVAGADGHLEVMTLGTGTLQNVFTWSIGQLELLAPATLSLALSQSGQRKYCGDHQYEKQFLRH